MPGKASARARQPRTSSPQAAFPYALELLARDDEREDEAEQREGFGEGDTEEHRRTDHAGRLRLTSHRRDGVADDEADADSRADGCAAVDDATADRGETRSDVRIGCRLSKY